MDKHILYELSTLKEQVYPLQIRIFKIDLKLVLKISAIYSCVYTSHLRPWFNNKLVFNIV